MIDKLLMSRPFRRYIESWMVILMPWILFTEQEAVTMDDFPAPPKPGPGASYDELRKEVDYDYERDRLEEEFTLTPEEEREMEDRRVVWNEDDWRKSPTEEAVAEILYNGPSEPCKECRGTGKLWGDSDCWGPDSYLGYTCPCQKKPTEEDDDDWSPYEDECTDNCDCQNPRA